MATRFKALIGFARMKDDELMVTAATIIGAMTDNVHFEQPTPALATVQVVQLAPINLPAKAMSVLNYIAVGLGIIEQVKYDGKDDPKAERKVESDADNEKSPQPELHTPSINQINRVEQFILYSQYLLSFCAR